MHFDRSLFSPPYRYIFWPILALVIIPEFVLLARVRRRRHVVSHDAGSLRLNVLGTLAAAGVALLMAGVPVLRFPRHAYRWVFACGITLLASAGLLRWHCRKVLGDYFTADVTTRSDHAVIDRGAYAWVRHPSYTAIILMTTGIGLALGSWAGAIVFAVVTVVVLRNRIEIEERVLLEALGKSYQAYMQRRKRLIPFIY
jgi:protein-S-isoprenylcysteine O-methyltransferase Ste14